MEIFSNYLMSLFTEASESSSSDILYVNFNQESTALSVGTKTGYKLYTLQESNKFEPDFECITNEDVCIVERHFLSSLVVLVKLSAPRKLIFYNFKTGSEITTKHFSNTILAIKLNRKIFVVCLEDSIHIYSYSEMSLLHVITNTPPNARGLCALTVTNDDSLLAYPGSSVAGDIQIFNASKCLAKTTIPAHKSPVVSIAFSHDGTKIASASEKGTVIRIFCVSSGKTLFDFRRGVRRYATIYSLSFSSCSEFLTASSNTETVHVFKLQKEENPPEIEEDSETWMDTFGKVLSYSATYLPSQMSDVLTQTRSFAMIQLPFSGLKNIACIARFRNTFYVFVASYDGFIYSYNLNSEGGPCPLSKQHRIDSNSRYSSAAPETTTNPTRSDEEVLSSPLKNVQTNKVVLTSNNQSQDTKENEPDDNPPFAFNVS